MFRPHLTFYIITSLTLHFMLHGKKNYHSVLIQLLIKMSLEHEYTPSEHYKITIVCMLKG